MQYGVRPVLSFWQLCGAARRRARQARHPASVTGNPAAGMPPRVRMQCTAAPVPSPACAGGWSPPRPELPDLAETAEWAGGTRSNGDNQTRYLHETDGDPLPADTERFPGKRYPKRPLRFRPAPAPGTY